LTSYEDEIRDNLLSGEPARIDDALDDFVDMIYGGFEVPIGPIGADLLQPFGDKPSTDLQRKLFKVLAQYPWFEPPLAPEHVWREAAELICRHADPAFIYHVVLKCRIAKEPAAAIGAILDTVAARGPIDERALEGTYQLVSTLLDGEDPVVAATLDHLQRLAAPLAPVVERIRPELYPEERKRFQPR